MHSDRRERQGRSCLCSGCQSQVPGNARGLCRRSGSERRIDDAGLHITVDGQPQLLEVDNVVLCAGQEPQRELHAALSAAGCSVHLIGGADVAAELDAKRAILQGTTLAASL